MVDIEAKYNQTTLHYEKNDSSLQQRVHTLENEKGNLNSVLKLYEDELKGHKERELNQNELQAKISELRYLLDKQTGEHRKEVELIRNECEGSIKNIKLLAESVKSFERVKVLLTFLKRRKQHWRHISINYLIARSLTIH